MLIRCAVNKCSLGLLLLAGTERGVCAVCLGDNEKKLVQALQAEYPGATLKVEDEAVREWLVRVLAHVEGKRPTVALPLDIQATAYQWRVWQQLVKIPPGETRSYTDIARLLGQPKAMRAVARACATNPVAVVIPCHRVVREDGGLGGYRWGLVRKKRLLEREEEMKVREPTRLRQR